MPAQRYHKVPKKKTKKKSKNQKKRTPSTSVCTNNNTTCIGSAQPLRLCFGESFLLRSMCFLCIAFSTHMARRGPWCFPTDRFGVSSPLGCSLARSHESSSLGSNIN